MAISESVMESNSIWRVKTTFTRALKSTRISFRIFVRGGGADATIAELRLRDSVPPTHGQSSHE